MKKIEELQRGKTIGAYGSTGSLVETKDNGSLLIQSYEQWPAYKNYFIDQRTGAVTDGGRLLLVNDQRLVKRLQDIGFTAIVGLFMPPVIEPDRKGFVYSPDVTSLSKMVSAKRFPEWFYCPHCRKLKKWSVWRKEWNQRFRDQDFMTVEPSCSCCSHRTGHGISKVKLEQVRFVLASMDGGDIKDIPWDTLLNQNTTDQVWPFGGLITGDLWYTTSKSTDGLYGISVTDQDPKITGVVRRKISMAEVDRHYFTDQNHAYKMVIRNGNNAYFPYILTSIYIPFCVPSDATVNNLHTAADRLSRRTDNNELAKAVYEEWNAYHPEAKVTIDIVENLIASGFDAHILMNYATEEEFLKDEYNHITNNENYQDGINNADSNFTAVNSCDILPLQDNMSFVKGLYNLKKLKETRTLVAYSRIESVPQSQLTAESLRNGYVSTNKMWYNVQQCEENRNSRVALKVPSNNAMNQIQYLPAVEAFGEGFFLQLELSKVGAADRLVFLHTYCHLVMKELEYECGYPVTSLKERIYYLPDPAHEEGGKYGFMIYSINGEDGSYGGISSLFMDDGRKIKKILVNAAERSKDCPNDPICSNDAGHCFACLDLPEIACCLLNTELNRNTFIRYYDPTFPINNTATHAHVATVPTSVSPRTLSEAASAQQIIASVQSSQTTQVSAFGGRMKAIVGHIEAQNDDVIVNAANANLRHGSGVCGAIHTAAGVQLEAECIQKYGKCNVGDCVITGSYNLPCKAVVHAVGPDCRIHVQKLNADQLLRSCYNNAIDLTLQKGYKSIAFPCISTGIFGFDCQHAAQIAVDTVALRLKSATDLSVTFVCYPDNHKNIQYYSNLISQLNKS